MTTITPPPPPIPPPTAPRSLPSVVVSNPPEALTKLVAGTQFEGTVVAGGAKTAVQLTTLYGTLQIQTTLPLEKGAKLNLLLQNLAPQVQLQITAINGKAPHVALRGLLTATPQPAQPAAGATPQGSAQAPAAPTGPAGLIGSQTALTLLRPPPALTAPTGQTTIPPAAATAATPQAGTPGPASPAPPPASVQPPPPSGSPAARPASTATAHATPPPAAPPVLAQGTQLPIRIAAVRLPTPGAPLPAPPAAAQALPTAGQTVTATVTSVTPQGPAILQTPLGPVTLATATALPHGTQLTLEITGQAVPPEAAKRPPPPLPPLTLFRAQDWPALREAYQVLQQIDPQAAHQLAAQTLPRPDSQLAANILFFVAALRGGDVRGWLGEKDLRILERVRPNLAARLGEEFRQMGGYVRDNLVGDWRIALIPFFNGQDLEQVRLFMKPYGGEDGDDSSGPQGIRFVVDVDLSRLGRLQLDGLVRDDKKRLDLIVRSEAPLPAAMQNDIRAIFENAAELTGVGGGVSFQAAPPDFVEIAAEPSPGQSPDIVA